MITKDACLEWLELWLRKSRGPSIIFYRRKFRLYRIKDSPIDPGTLYQEEFAAGKTLTLAIMAAMDAEKNEHP